MLYFKLDLKVRFILVSFKFYSENILIFVIVSEFCFDIKQLLDDDYIICQIW